MEVTDIILTQFLFSLRITYDTQMNTGVSPTVTFTPDVSSTLTFNASQSFWISDRTYLASYDVTDADASVPEVAVAVTGARDSLGNVQTGWSGAHVFWIDTFGPTPSPGTVLSVTPDPTLVTDAHIGTAAFALRITYDQSMNTNYNPVLTFTPGVAGTLTYDAAWSWWVSDTTFLARYDVADANVLVGPVGVGVTGAFDALTKQLQTAYTGTDNFTIDTSNPPPAYLTAVGVSDSQIDLTWTDNSPNAAGYKVQRSADGTTWPTATTFAAPDPTYSDSGLTEGTLYYYRVCATSPNVAEGDSAYSDAVSAGTLPTAPSTLTETFSSGNRIDLHWVDASTHASGYFIEQHVGDAWEEIAASGPTARTVSLPGPFEPSTEYTFQVAAYTQWADSAPSPELVFTTPTWPEAPANLTASTANAGEIDLSWDPSAGASHYTLSQFDASSPNPWVAIDTVPSTQTTYTVSGLTEGGATYSFQVVATNTRARPPIASWTTSQRATTRRPLTPRPPRRIQSVGRARR